MTQSWSIAGAGNGDREDVSDGGGPSPERGTKLGVVLLLPE